MRGIRILSFGLVLLGFMSGGLSGEIIGDVSSGVIPRFKIEVSDLNLSRAARPMTYFDKVGRKFAILGYESGSFEAWAYPLKILRNFELSFLIGSTTVPIEGRDIVRYIAVEPAATTLTFTYQSFTVRVHYVASIKKPGAVILLEVDTTEPLTIVCSFLPVLQPMWPAGIGGQYAFWDANLKAYLISEPTRMNHGYVGSPAAKGISYTPAHMLSDAANQFKIDVDDPEEFGDVFIPLILAGGKGRREDVRRVYQDLETDPEACYREAVSHYENLRARTLEIHTPKPEIDLAVEWAKVAYDNLFIANPDLGLGFVAGLGPSGSGGRPGFGWYFGGDAYLNSLSLNSLCDYEDSREALSFTQKWQRADGKMAHELSQAAGYIEWWEDYPYGFIHGDTTPYYIVAMGDYFRMTGDLEFLKESWPSLLRAYEWCLTTDEDGDGLMDNSKAGLGALEFGALTGIQTDVYLAAIWTKANMEISKMADVVGDKGAAKKSAENGRKAEKAFNNKFWSEENEQYVYAFNKDGGRVSELTPWSAVGLALGLGELERGRKTLVRMNSAELTTDWGVRMLSIKSPLFEPLNYNYGAAWPFLTGWVSAALFKHNFIPQGFHTLMSSVRHTFDNALGCVTELFSGTHNIWPGEGVPHQGFCTSGVVYPLVRGMLGLEGDIIDRTISFSPRLPADWPRLSVGNFRIGSKTFAFEYEREDDAVKIKILSEKDNGFYCHLAPALSLGTKILSVNLNGIPLSYDLDPGPLPQAEQPRMEFALSEEDVIEISLDAGPEIIPPETKTKTGDMNKGLKIISTERRENEIRIVVEGIAGVRYELEVRNGKKIASVEGASFDGKRLGMNISSGKGEEFLKHSVVLRLK